MGQFTTTRAAKNEHKDLSRRSIIYEHIQSQTWHHLDSDAGLRA
jgi:hypothetical protein